MDRENEWSVRHTHTHMADRVDTDTHKHCSGVTHTPSVSPHHAVCGYCVVNIHCAITDDDSFDETYIWAVFTPCVYDTCLFSQDKTETVCVHPLVHPRLHTHIPFMTVYVKKVRLVFDLKRIFFTLRAHTPTVVGCYIENDVEVTSGW